MPYFFYFASKVCTQVSYKWCNMLPPNSFLIFFFFGCGFVENFEILQEFEKIRNLEFDFVRAMWWIDWWFFEIFILFPRFEQNDALPFQLLSHWGQKRFEVAVELGTQMFSRNIFFLYIFSKVQLGDMDFFVHRKIVR